MSKSNVDDGKSKVPSGTTENSPPVHWRVRSNPMQPRPGRTPETPHFLNLPTTYITIVNTTLTTTEVASGK